MHRKIRFALSALLVALSCSAVAWGGRPEADGAEQVVKIEARRFEFSPAEVTVRKGAPVVVEITTRDVVHGFSLPDFGVRAEVQPGKVTRVRFTADKAGRFSFLCDVYCGSGHEEMSGTLVVTE